MKKLRRFLPILLLMMTAWTLTSCQDDDEQLAYNLDGVWEGVINDAGGNQYNTTFKFYQEGGIYSSHGYGEELDTGWHTGTSYVAFNWHIHNGDIQIEYDNNPYYQAHYIYIDYDQLPASSKIGARFSGRFVEGTSGKTLASFYLVKTGNWDDRGRYRATEK